MDIMAMIIAIIAIIMAMIMARLAMIMAIHGHNNGNNKWQ